LDSEDQVQLYVWMLDSSDNDCQHVSGWGCVYPDQVEWFRNKSAALKEKDGRTVPGMAFFHIPLPEANSSWGPQAVGAKEEAVCPFSVNTGLFAAMVDEGNIVSAWSGHDHNNDYGVAVKGITIGYGRKSGYGGYGGTVADKPGSRTLEVHVADNGTFSWSTWIRLESGEKCIQKEQGQICGVNETVAALSPARLAANEQCRMSMQQQTNERANCRAAVGLDDEVSPAIWA